MCTVSDLDKFQIWQPEYYPSFVCFFVLLLFVLRVHSHVRPQFLAKKSKNKIKMYTRCKDTRLKNKHKNLHPCREHTKIQELLLTCVACLSADLLDRGFLFFVFCLFCTSEPPYLSINWITQINTNCIWTLTLICKGNQFHQYLMKYFSTFFPI